MVASLSLFELKLVWSLAEVRLSLAQLSPSLFLAMNILKIIYLLGRLKVQTHFWKYKEAEIKVKQAGAELCQAQFSFS